MEILMFKYSFSGKGVTPEGIKVHFKGEVNSNLETERDAFWEAVYKANDAILKLSPGFIIDGTKTINGLKSIQFPTMRLLKNKPKKLIK